MEDENGIELSLGLSCGGSTGKLNDKDECSDRKAEELGNDKSKGQNLNLPETSIKHFFNIGIEDQVVSGSQRSDPVVQQQENFFTDLGRFYGQETNTSTDIHGSRYQELWSTNNNLVKFEEDKGKRKFPFEEVKHQKKHESEAEYADEHGNSGTSINLLKGSHISVTTEDGFSAENEEVAESDVDGSTLWLASQKNDSIKQYRGGGSDVPNFKDKQLFIDANAMDNQGRKRSSVRGNESGPGFEHGNPAYRVPFPLQPTTIMSGPYSLPVKVPTTAPTSNSLGFPSSSFMQMMPPGSSEHPIIQSISPGIFPAAFNYSSVQLPTTEASHPQRFSAYAGRSLGDGVHSDDGLKIPQASVQVPHSSSAAFQNNRKASELLKVGQHATEQVTTCSSSHTEEEMKGKNAIFRLKEVSDQSSAEAIRPGVATSLKFGGSGSYPDLPWVSSRGPGPNGKTISGVTYKYGNNQIRIVCACHGSHMSPEEFVQHASADANNPGNSVGLASYPNSNPATSAQI